MSTSDTFSRRTFLRNSALTAGALALPSEFAAPASAADMPRIGFIGVKNRGMQNLPPLVQYAVAVCDVDSNVLAAAKKYVETKTGRTCDTYSDYRKLLERKDIDAVVISTPDLWHALPSINACEAGKDVYCEKPLSLTIAEGKAMVAAARRYNRIVQTGSQQRSDDKFRLACELVRSGRIGKVHTVRVGIPGVNFSAKAVPDSQPPAELDYDFWLGPAPKRPYNVNRVHYNFRFFWDYSGGQMTNWGAHHLDIAQWGLGMDESGPISVEGTASYKPDQYYEVPTAFQLTYQYANGVTLLCGSGPGFRGGTTFEGDKGTIWVDRGKLESKPDDIIMQPLSSTDVHLRVSKNHYTHWLECLRTRQLPITDVAIGHRSATVCHLGNVAIRTKRKVTWDPKEEKIVGDAEQEAMVSRPYREPWKI